MYGKTENEMQNRKKPVRRVPENGSVKPAKQSQAIKKFTACGKYHRPSVAVAVSRQTAPLSLVFATKKKRQNNSKNQKYTSVKESH